MARDSLAVAALAATSLLGACQADRPSSNKPDAMVESNTLNPPSIDPATPMSTPNDTVAVRGTSGATRVLVKGGPGDPVVRSVLPTGGFCVDAPLNASGPTVLAAFALKDGQISQSATLTVTKDPAAPIPQDPMCLGMEQPTCVPEDQGHGDCTNGADDDCNGFTDACDPNCNGCVDDALGPNWTPFLVPSVAPGTYKLEICPCRDDWFAFSVAAGTVIHVKATFNNADIDLDMMLQTAMDAENNATTNVAISQTVTNTEEINYTAAADGNYYLKIYPYDTTKFGAYTLTIY